MEVKIKNEIWRILKVDSNNKNLMRGDKTLTLGTCDNSSKTIYLNKNLKKYMLDKVLCHELTHAFCFEYDYYLDIDTEEIVADFMSLYGREIIYMLDDIAGMIRRIA